MPQRKKIPLLLIYSLATIQFAWCYLWLTRAYVNTSLYEHGRERMPFQGRMLMMLPMRLAHSSVVLHGFARFFRMSHFWFPRPVSPEVIIQAAVNQADAIEAQAQAQQQQLLASTSQANGHPDITSPVGQPPM